jgi:hypothetical protein
MVYAREAGRLMEKASASFCEQKEAKKLCLFWSREFRSPKAQINSSFLVLFFKKAPLPCFGTVVA